MLAFVRARPMTSSLFTKADLSSENAGGGPAMRPEGAQTQGHIWPPRAGCADERPRRGRTVACELNALSGDADLEISPPAHEGGPGPKSSREVRKMRS